MFMVNINMFWLVGGVVVVVVATDVVVPGNEVIAWVC